MDPRGNSERSLPTVNPRFFDAGGTELRLHDTEDKDWWLRLGQRLEDSFIALCREKKVLHSIRPNPERTSAKAYLPEFVWKGAPLDVKVQRQPFFESWDRFGIRPRYAVTINLQDIVDIRDKYPTCRVAIWVDWLATRYVKTDPADETVSDITVEPLHGVWLVDPTGLERLGREGVERGRHHTYGRRLRDKKGNARGSYVVDVRRLTMVWLDRALPAYEPLEDGALMLPRAR